MISDGGMRASDRDREYAVEVLRAAHAAGRLGPDEFLDRCGAAYAARSWQELRDLTADLPMERPVIGGQPNPGRGTYYDEVTDLRYMSSRRSALVWVTAVAGLLIAAVAPVAVAVPLVVFALCALCANSLFVLCTTWTRAPLVRKFVVSQAAAAGGRHNWDPRRASGLPRDSRGSADRTTAADWRW